MNNLEKVFSFKIKFLHLSDLHKKADQITDGVHAGVVTSSLLKKIGEITARGEVFDFVIVTGDLAYSGQKEEYTQAETFLDQLLAVTGLENHQLFLVPGNHDIDRKEIKPAHIRGWYTCDDEEQITEILNDQDFFPVLMRKFNHFNAFANKMMGSDNFRESSLFYVEPVQLHRNGVNWTLNLVGLNSSLFAGYDGDDKQKLAFGLQQVTGAVNRLAPGARLSLAFFHHPLECLHKADEAAKNILLRKMQLLLCGHGHAVDFICRTGSTGQTVIVAAGAAYEKRQSGNSFNIIEVDLVSGEGMVQPFKYLPPHDLWKEDTDTNPNTRDGHFPFKLKLPGPQNNHHVPGPLLPTRYLRWLQDQCATIDIRGLEVGKGKVYKFGIEELYIPLTTSRQLPHSEFTDTRKTIEEKKINLDQALQARYLTIVGDPGSGKTTFLRRIAYLLTRGLLKDDDSATQLGMEPELLPVLIKVGEFITYMENQKKKTLQDCPSLESDSTWFFHFLHAENRSRNWGLQDHFFSKQLASGKIVLLLDGLDEAPDRQQRECLSEMLIHFKQAYDRCRIVVTTRPKAYTGMVVLQDFTEAKIAELTDEAIDTFLQHWTKALHSGNQLTATAESHHKELKEALTSRWEIKRMAINPVMLTALAVVHWNECRLPEQRADLYKSITTWLLRSREKRPGRVKADTCKNYLCKIALAMQRTEQGRVVELGKRKAAETISAGFPGKTLEEKLTFAERFLEEEEVDSGIIVSRGSSLAFWHLTFQEYLAAVALGGKVDARQKDILIDPRILHDPAWREVLLLFCGVLFEQGLDKINGFLDSILSLAVQAGTLKEKAEWVGLIGSMLFNLQPYDFQFADDHYRQLLAEVMAIFDREKAEHLPLDIREEAADALGRAGDPRLLEDRMVPIAGGIFYMGAQKKDKEGLHFDQDARNWESPVHEVRLSPYKIFRYPVTVREYWDFIRDNGYTQEKYWTAGGYGQFDSPDKWASQESFPTRPVVGVSWFEAKAYTVWKGVDLPTEAQWERAARGPEKEYKKYPWGVRAPDGKVANSDEAGLGHASPVGLFPGDCSADGIMDLGGNVWEWCRDWLDVDDHEKESDFYVKSNGGVDPVNDKEGKWGIIGPAKSRIVRGGCFAGSGRNSFRCAFRDYDRPVGRSSLVGFRVVLRSSEI